MVADRLRTGKMLQDIRVITLDLDDTLWDVLPVIRRAEAALNDWLAARYPRIPERWPAERVRALRKDVVKRHADQAHDLTFLRKQVLTLMAQDAGYEAALSEAAFAVFDEHRNALETFPDVEPALSKLTRCYRVIAVTNGNADLRKIGIDRWFDGFVSARTAGAAKPDRRIFAAAVAAGGASPAETLHVGDHPHQDVAGAREAGLRSVWVNRRRVEWPAEHAPADLEVSDLCVLADFLTSDKPGAS